MATSDVIRISAGIPMKEEWCLAAPVDFSLGSDEHIAIYGPNASGKSKLVDIILARHPLKSGTVAYSFPSPTRKYVCDNVKCLEFRDCYGGETDRDYYHQQRWNQWDVRDSRVLLSSGELRKLSLDKVLEGEPCVLVLDSPFVGLDAASRKELDGRLRAIAASGRTRLLLVLSRSDEMPDYITHVVPVENQVVLPKMTLAQWRSSNVEQPLREGNPMPEVSALCGRESACADGFRGEGPAAPELVRLEKVSIRYGDRTILKDLDWVVRKGERWALVGVNGSGKSTLLSLVCADNPQAYACRISLFGHRRGSGESIWDIKKHIGYVSPELHRSFRRDIPAVNIVAGGLKDYHGMFTVPSPDEIAAAIAWMERLGIAALRDRRFLSLSSGEQRLVLVARAFVRNPDLLILDEPLHGLDNANRLMVRNLIEEYCSDPDRTLIMVTHYAEELPPCINRCLRLERNPDDTSGVRIWDDMVSGREYDATHPFLLERLNATKDRIWEYNNMRPSMLKERNELLRELLGRSDEDSFINQPFFCDYGCNIFVGRRFFANFNLTVLDEAPVTIGDDCFIGPNVSIYTACHSTDPVERNTRREWAKPVTIGDNVWIGGSVTILPGVNIGSNVTIGAGSVVVKDIPDGCVAVGNPCRVVKYLNITN